MKKVFLMLLGALSSLSTFARDFEFEYAGQTLTYTVTDENARTVMVKEGEEYTAPGNNVKGALVIPSTAKEGNVEYTVTSIGASAFNCCQDLTSVSIPWSVTSIGRSAFWECVGLVKAEFASIESLCRMKFGNAFSNPISYSGNLYIRGTEITELEIPNSITKIIYATFYGYKSLSSVTIPTSVTEIGNIAFEDCTGLTEIKIPNSVKIISDFAFGGCSGLTSVTIPNSVTEIRMYAFCDCTALTSFDIPNSVTTIGNGVFYGDTSLTSVSIPNSIQSIPDYTFRDCSGLTSVIIPTSVTEIGIEAFYNCYGLTEIEIPGSVNTIGTDAFEKCDGLTKVYYGAEEPVSGESGIFSTVAYGNATLYVPAAAVEKCRQIDPWKNFANIEAYDFAGIDGAVTDAADAPREVYNANGVLVSDTTEGLAPGLYIVRQGGKVRKIAVN